MSVELRELHEHVRVLRAQRAQMPARLSIAVSRGTFFHLPGCHSLRSSGNVISHLFHVSTVFRGQLGER